MPKVSIELNFFYMHFNDAKTFTAWARKYEHGKVNPSIYVRHAIISVVFASEALINRVLMEFSVDRSIAETLERSSILDKWYLAPLLCTDSASKGLFDKGADPYQSFKELVQIRNWLAHPKVENFLDAELDRNSTITIAKSRESYPWLEMLKGEVLSKTKIPANPFEMNHEHAQASIVVLESMISALRAKLSGKLNDEWLEQITIKDADGVHSYKAPVSTIWGGYGGARS